MNMQYFKNIAGIVGMVLGIGVILYAFYFLLLLIPIHVLPIGYEEFSIIKQLIVFYMLTLIKWVVLILYFTILFSLAAFWIWLRPQDLELLKRALYAVLRFAADLFNYFTHACSEGVRSLGKAWRGQ
jgi:hypothetical protein